MKRTLALAAAATVAGGIVAFSVASYASSDHASTSSDDPYTAAALDVANVDVASASGPTASPSPSGGSSKTTKREFLHGEHVVKDRDGKLITVDGQRGSVTAASATSLTVKSDDGTTWTWTIGKDTKVRGAKLEVEPAPSVKVGDTVAVGGQRTGDTRTARAVIDPPPNRKDLRGDLRKLRRDLRILHGR